MSLFLADEIQYFLDNLNVQHGPSYVRGGFHESPISFPNVIFLFSADLHVQRGPRSAWQPLTRVPVGRSLVRQWHPTRLRVCRLRAAAGAAKRQL